MHDQGNHSWGEYYRKVAQRPPRDLFVMAVERFEHPGRAVDLGCGGGVETRELLRRGWEVVAVDQEAAAFEHLASTIPEEERARLIMQRASFGDLSLPTVDFIWAGLSLPFATPADFPALWQAIRAALPPGGRFAGDLFGTRHAWRDDPELIFHTREEVQALLAGFDVELLAEVEEERQTAFQGRQPWHGFDIIVRRRRDV